MKQVLILKILGVPSLSLNLSSCGLARKSMEASHSSDLIHSDLTESVCNVVLQSQFPHKSVNLFFILVKIKAKLTDLCGN